MDIRIIDRERHTTRPDDKGRALIAALRGVQGANLFAVLDGLLNNRDNANPAVEFVCDWEFFRALEGMSEGQLVKPDLKWTQNHEAHYRNTPIMVVGEEPPRDA